MRPEVTHLTHATWLRGYKLCMLSAQVQMDVTPTKLRFEPRMQGITRAALGGYVAGSVASRLGGPAEVNLRSLPPLETDLELRDAGDGSLQLLNDDELVADARAAVFELEVPDPPPLAEAREAADRLVHDEGPHPFPNCFCCGPAREPGDALRLQLGRGRSDSGPLVSLWTPHPELAEGDELPPEMVWAALDCPSIWAAWSDRRPAQPRQGMFDVLARQRLQQVAPVPLGEPAIVSAWMTERRGRKTLSGTAIHDTGGRLLVRADALLVEVPIPT